jgi:hypothetical protein
VEGDDEAISNPAAADKFVEGVLLRDSGQLEAWGVGLRGRVDRDEKALDRSASWPRLSASVRIFVARRTARTVDRYFPPHNGVWTIVQSVGDAILVDVICNRQLPWTAAEGIHLLCCPRGARAQVNLLRIGLSRTVQHPVLHPVIVDVVSNEIEWILLQPEQQHFFRQECQHCCVLVDQPHRSCR